MPSNIALGTKNNNNNWPRGRGETWPLILAGVFFLGSKIARETKDLVRLAWRVKNAILGEDFIQKLYFSPINLNSLWRGKKQL